MPGRGSHTMRRTTLGAPGAGAATSEDQTIIIFSLSSSPWLCLLGWESPKDTLTHYPAAHKGTYGIFPSKPPVSSKWRPSRVQAWGADTGQPHSAFASPVPLGQKACPWSSSRAPFPPMARAIFFSLLFTLYCSCFCTGKRCWSAQKSFRSRLAAELCLIIVIIWKQVMGIFPMLI